MTPKKEPKGCGGTPSTILYRGRAKRTFLCDDCLPEYEGSGGRNKYAVDVAGQEKVPKVHYGPARTCGQTVESEDS